MTSKKLFQNLKIAVKNNVPVLITGQPGIGKSDIVAQLAKFCDYDIILSHPVIADPTDYKGLPAIINNTAVFLPIGDLNRLINADKPTICFFDDLGQAVPLTQSAIMQIILARQIGEHKVSDNVRFIMATNRAQDRASVHSILEPLKNRCLIINVEFDIESWTDWALHNNITHEIIAFARFRPNLLSDWKPANGMENTCTPRTISMCAQWYLNTKQAELDVFTGFIGEGAAVELISFLQVYNELPSRDEILLNPDTARLPEKIASLYAIIGALSSIASTSNFDRIMIYANRFPKDKIEFNVLLVKECIKKCPQINSTKTFIMWASDHKEVLI